MLIRTINLIYSNNRSKLCESIFKSVNSSKTTNRFFCFSKSLRVNKENKYYSTKHQINSELNNDKNTIRNSGEVLESNDFQVNLNVEKKFLEIALDNGQFYQFPYVWLRDNCQCDFCFHTDSNSRTIDWATFDVNVYPKSVEINSSCEIKVNWSDGHHSIFTTDWLKQRNFNETHQKEYLHKCYRPKKTLWSKQDFDKILHTFNYKEVLHENEVLKDWLQCLAKYGVAMISKTPQTDQECRKLANRVGFIRKTHYGEEFIVQAKSGTTNVAYLSTHLQMHTDLPYYDYKPGVNLLHCLVQSQSKGGENLLADAFNAANTLKINYPEYHELLATVLVNWSDVGEEDGNKFHSINRAPIICIGRDGVMERINYSVPQRDSTFTVPLEKVVSWYEAKAKFVELIHQESVAFKTQPGDILTFDNIRMVHGRTGYTDYSNNTRYIVGAYLDWDEIYSKLRVLK